MEPNFAGFNPTTPRVARRSRVGTACGAAITLALVLAVVRPAHGWDFVSGTNAYGDAATAIVQPARNRDDAVLAIGCDGDRWRMVAIGPRRGSALALARDPQVRTAFSGAELGKKEKWLTQPMGPSGQIAYAAPAPSQMIRALVQAEAASPDAVFRAEVQSKGKPVLLEFPLAGLRKALRRDLWEPCKLGNYVPESEIGE